MAIAKLPNLNEDCPPGRHLISSGWGIEKRERIEGGFNGQDDSRKDDSKKRDDGFEFKLEHDELWSVAQECLDKSKCPYYKGDQERILCVGDAEEITNGPCHADSGGTF